MFVSDNVDPRISGIEPEETTEPEPSPEHDPIPAATDPQTAEPAPVPASLLTERPQEVDDLKEIKGVGVVLERKLNAAGIFHFWQIAALTETQIEVLEADMSFPGRIARDNWVDQAKDFAAQLSL